MLKNLTGTLPGIGPFSRVGFSYDPEAAAAVRRKLAPKRKTVRHYPKEIRGHRCVRLVPCEVADRLG